MDHVHLVIVATTDPTEKEALSQYLKNVNLLYDQVGAKQVAKYSIDETLIGDTTQTPTFSLVMQFPSREALETVFMGDAYEKLIPYRKKAFLKLEAYISER